MLFVSVPSFELLEMVPKGVDGIELRLDLFSSIDFPRLQDFLQNSPHPVLLTLRKKSQGGNFQASERAREALMERLLDLGPSFFDLEYDMRPEFIQSALKKYPKTKFILSYHNFEKIPSDLAAVLQAMSQHLVFSYKIAVKVHSANEALQMLLFSKKHPEVSAICMGEEGAFARILGKLMGNRIDYACIDSQRRSAPGQISADDLVKIYNYPSLNEKTLIYGLIGDPVEKSIGHIYHNGVFRKRGIDAVYVKMRVRLEKLAEFLPLAKEVGIRGLSVTMPLKEAIVPFVSEIEPGAQKIGSLNTLILGEEQIVGTNTDGIGALDAIEQKISIQGKKVVLLGAGGAARAIAYEARKRGADVLVLNRTIQRAEEWARAMGCQSGGLDELPNHYDVLINCSSIPMPIKPEEMVPKTVVMDIVYAPRKTPFLKAALLKKCRIVYGEKMFLNQAAQQTHLFFS